MKSKILGLLFIMFLFSQSQGFSEVEVGKAAPDFTLTDTAGNAQTLSNYKGKYVVLEWTNPDCPFVKKHYGGGNMQDLQKEETDAGAIWLTLNSSAPGKEGSYNPEDWNRIVREKKMSSTAVLLDPAGKVGQLYEAKTTPHMFIINPDGILIYQGAIDDKPSTDAEDIKGATNYVRKALNESRAGQAVTIPATKSYGCSIKYKK